MSPSPSSIQIASKQISTAVAARILGVSQDTVTRFCEDGTLEAERMGSRGWWRIWYDSVIKMKRKS